MSWLVILDFQSTQNMKVQWLYMYWFDWIYYYNLTKKYISTLLYGHMLTLYPKVVPSWISDRYKIHTLCKGSSNGKIQSWFLDLR